MLQQFSEGRGPDKGTVLANRHMMSAYTSADEQLELPDRFVVYPANVWPHKNHAARLDALNWDSGPRCPFLVNPERAADPDVYRCDTAAFLGFLADWSFGVLELHRLFGETYAFRGFHISTARGDRLPAQGPSARARDDRGRLRRHRGARAAGLGVAPQ